MPLDQLTKRQRAVYDFISDKIQNRGYGPTVREIAKKFGISSPNGVVCHLKALEKKGFIRRKKKESRAIELTDLVKHNERGLPLRGRIAAGTLHEAIEQNDRIDFGDMFKRHDLYVLEITGDSMVEAQIADGDFVVIEPRQVADRGEMVVARTEDGEATLKYWFPEKNRIRLQPANSKIDPIYVKKAEVLGAVVGVVRNLS